jgi:hypothetical protein
MTSDVEKALEEIRQSFVGHHVEIDPLSDGGADVTVHGLVLGDKFAPPVVWIGFRISYQYPFPDIYPHFTVPELRLANGAGFSGGISPGAWRGAPAAQISRRSHSWNPMADTAAIKLSKTLAWLRAM